MPYILPEERNAETFCRPTTPGQLTWVLTIIAQDYVRHNGESYQHYSEVLGSLEAAKLEFYRREVAPYEDRKIEENGDV